MKHLRLTIQLLCFTYIYKYMLKTIHNKRGYKKITVETTTKKKKAATFLTAKSTCFVIE